MDQTNTKPGRMERAYRGVALAIAIAMFLNVSVAIAIDRVDEMLVLVTQGSTTNFPYSQLVTNAINPAGAAHVAGVPMGMSTERRGVTSMDHQQIIYRAPVDWVGEEEIRYRLADEANHSRYGTIVIRVIEEGGGESGRQ